MHTSDWHIGANFHRASRLREHAAFFSWLRNALEERAVDVLVVAGDVFDRAHPSNEAQQLYFDALVSLRDTRLSKVVIVGGNHDSPSFLDAPELALDRLDVTVIGGWNPSRPDRHIIPLARRGQQPAAVLIALPFINEWQLGVRAAGAPATELRAQMTAAFAALYRQLCDRAAQLLPGAPMLGTGHLTVDGFELRADDAPRDIHFVGRIAGLPSEIFDPRLRYVALGHIHRPMPVLRGRGWYSGTPIPMGVSEMSVGRRVLLIDVPDGAGPNVELKPSALSVPLQRALLPLEGALDEVLLRLAELRWDEPMPPFVTATLLVKELIPDAAQRLHRHIEDVFPDPGCRPLLVDCRQVAPQVESFAGREVPDASSLSVGEVFELLCERTVGVELDDELRAAFDGAVAAVERTA